MAKYVDDLEETCSAILEKTVRRFLAKTCQRLGEIIRRYWRKPFGDNIGDLEKHGRRSYVYFVLEIIME